LLISLGSLTSPVEQFDFSFIALGAPAMDFRTMTVPERERLTRALRSNATGESVLLTDRANTRFLGTANETPDEEVIAAVKSIPIHY
jgi:hypothetical protein